MNTSDKSIALLEKITGKKITFGNFLWAIRECEETSQTAFAKLLGISRQYLCDVERGRKTISLEVAVAFAKKLGYSPTHFVRLVLQDALNKAHLHFDIELHERKKAA